MWMPHECGGRKPKPTPVGAPEGREPRMGERQCGGRKPKPTPVGAPEGREPRMGERQCGGRKPKPTPVGAPEGREPRMGERQPSSLADLLADARVWKLKNAPAAPSRPVWSTGSSSLDARLPGGGWPTASLVEVLIDDTGLGEVQLFLPALVRSQRSADGDVPWLVWIAPPHEPYAPALAQLGIELG